MAKKNILTPVQRLERHLLMAERALERAQIVANDVSISAEVYGAVCFTSSLVFKTRHAIGNVKQEEKICRAAQTAFDLAKEK